MCPEGRTCASHHEDELHKGTVRDVASWEAWWPGPRWSEVPVTNHNVGLGSGVQVQKSLKPNWTCVDFFPTTCPLGVSQLCSNAPIVLIYDLVQSLWQELSLRLASLTRNKYASSLIVHGGCYSRGAPWLSGERWWPKMMGKMLMELDPDISLDKLIPETVSKEVIGLV